MASKIHIRIYMDYASTTPVDKQVLKAMLPFMAENFGNASAFYKEGLFAKDALQNARKEIAQILNVKSEEIIFTASGTESDNLAVFGVFKTWKKIFNQSLGGAKPHII